MTESEQRKMRAIENVMQLAGRDDDAYRQALDSLWAEAFQEGRLAALNELQDRLCVCMK